MFSVSYYHEMKIGFIPSSVSSLTEMFVLDTSSLIRSEIDSLSIYLNFLVNCTWDNQTRSYSNQIIAHWISMATKGEPLK